MTEGEEVTDTRSRLGASATHGLALPLGALDTIIT